MPYHRGLCVRIWIERHLGNDFSGCDKKLPWSIGDQAKGAQGQICLGRDAPEYFETIVAVPDVLSRFSFQEDSDGGVLAFGRGD